jgi:hypothetical protein
MNVLRGRFLQRLGFGHAMGVLVLIAAGPAVRTPAIAAPATASPDRPAPASPATTRELPACNTIPVELVDKLDSGTAHVGDRFRFRAIDTVLTRDRVRITSGTIGYGLVTYASAAGAHAKAGTMLVEARYFALPKGRQYQVTIDTEISHSGSNRNAPGIVGAIPVPFMGVAVGAFNYFHAGSNVTVPTGYHFNVTPVGSLGSDPNCLWVAPAG